MRSISTALLVDRRLLGNKLAAADRGVTFATKSQPELIRYKHQGSFIIAILSRTSETYPDTYGCKKSSMLALLRRGRDFGCPERCFLLGNALRHLKANGISGIINDG